MFHLYGAYSCSHDEVSAEVCVANKAVLVQYRCFFLQYDLVVKIFQTKLLYK